MADTITGTFATRAFGTLPASVRASITKARSKNMTPGRKRLTAKTPISFHNCTDVGVGYSCQGNLGGLYFENHPELASAIGLA